MHMMVTKDPDGDLPVVPMPKNSQPSIGSFFVPPPKFQGKKDVVPPLPRTGMSILSSPSSLRKELDKRM